MVTRGPMQFPDDVFEPESPDEEQDVTQLYSSYEQYVAAQVTLDDLFYLEDQDLAEVIIKLGYRGSGGVVITPEHFQKNQQPTTDGKTHSETSYSSLMATSSSGHISSDQSFKRGARGLTTPTAVSTHSEERGGLPKSPRRVKTYTRSSSEPLVSRLVRRWSSQDTLSSPLISATNNWQESPSETANERHPRPEKVRAKVPMIKAKSSYEIVKQSSQSKYAFLRKNHGGGFVLMDQNLSPKEYQRQFPRQRRFGNHKQTKSGMMMPQTASKVATAQIDAQDANERQASKIQTGLGYNFLALKSHGYRLCSFEHLPGCAAKPAETRSDHRRVNFNIQCQEHDKHPFENQPGSSLVQPTPVGLVTPAGSSDSEQGRVKSAVYDGRLDHEKCVTGLGTSIRNPRPGVTCPSGSRSPVSSADRVPAASGPNTTERCGSGRQRRHRDKFAGWGLSAAPGEGPTAPDEELARLCLTVHSLRLPAGAERTGRLAGPPPPGPGPTRLTVPRPTTVTGHRQAERQRSLVSTYTHTARTSASGARR
ncbi:uncharacterized protein LOC122364239 [Amphibalanus amphitrite]|uniref:uncharacterized protein LOC122364239 n=1 Tax=Amphibalanus amphitrite TaxID=1232801 RepID=UPI001C90A88F|nr:uncharacterized protein LOC122364239 [Amphibalanus amphitrite]